MVNIFLKNMDRKWLIQQPLTHTTLKTIKEWETNWNVTRFDCDESLTWWGLNLNLG
jgi:hypothetical protein